MISGKRAKCSLSKLVTGDIFYVQKIVRCWWGDTSPHPPPGSATGRIYAKFLCTAVIPLQSCTRGSGCWVTVLIGSNLLPLRRQQPPALQQSAEGRGFSISD